MPTTFLYFRAFENDCFSVSVIFVWVDYVNLVYFYMYDWYNIYISFMITHYNILYQSKSFSLLNSCEMFAVGLFAVIACRNLGCNNALIIVNIIFRTVKICCSDCVLNAAVCAVRINEYSHISAFEPFCLCTMQSLYNLKQCLLYTCVDLHYNQCRSIWLGVFKYIFVFRQLLACVKMYSK